MKSRCIYVVLVVLVGAGSEKATQQYGECRQKNQPTYHVTMAPRTMPAINYENRKSTEIGFEGSPLLPLGKGHAKVTSERGRIAIDAEFKHLVPAQKFGAEYLTYVLWAITPEGKTNNLGEVLLDGNQNKIKVTTSLQTFGLIVTAEPYYAVSEPSDAVVLENVVRSETRGTIQQMSANYRLLGRGQYGYDVAGASQSYPKSKVPIEVEEARNAVQIAKSAGARQYAPDAFDKAKESLAEAEAVLRRKGDKKQIVQSARDAVQNAADARRIAVKHLEDEQAASEKAAEAQRTAQAQAEAAAAAAKEQQEQVARQQAEQQAQMEAQRAKQEQQAAAQAKQAAARAEREKEELRATLLQRFSRILPTTDTPRDLKVTISDVLLATAKYDLRAPAREALAKFSGIIVAHPGLKLQVEGYTDIVGGDNYNQTLSENPSKSVRAYLINRGF